MTAWTLSSPQSCFPDRGWVVGPSESDLVSPVPFKFARLRGTSIPSPRLPSPLVTTVDGFGSDDDDKIDSRPGTPKNKKKGDLKELMRNLEKEEKKEEEEGEKRKKKKKEEEKEEKKRKTVKNGFAVVGDEQKEEEEIRTNRESEDNAVNNFSTEDMYSNGVIGGGATGGKGGRGGEEKVDGGDREEGEVVTPRKRRTGEKKTKVRVDKLQDCLVM